MIFICSLNIGLQFCSFGHCYEKIMTFLGIQMSEYKEMDRQNADAIELYPGTSQEVKQMMFLSSKGKINVGLVLEMYYKNANFSKTFKYRYSICVFMLLCRQLTSQFL